MMELASMITILILLATFVFALLLIEYHYEVRYMYELVAQKVSRIFLIRKP